MISILGLKKEEVLKALYDRAKVQGLGFIQMVPGDMDIEEAKGYLKKYTYFDYLKGRVIKIDLSRDDEFDERLYDRDNGAGAAQRAISHLL